MGSDEVIPISGLYESHLTVSDLDRSIVFHRDVVGLELAHRVPARHAAFFWVGGRERSMLGLWSIHSSPIRLRLHIAFSTDLEHVKRSVSILRSNGIIPRRGGGGPELDEPAVFPWMPAASVYFDDPDGHSLEYICILPDPPRPDLSATVPLDLERNEYGGLRTASVVEAAHMSASDHKSDIEWAIGEPLKADVGFAQPETTLRFMSITQRRQQPAQNRTCLPG